MQPGVPVPPVDVRQPTGAARADGAAGALPRRRQGLGRAHVAAHRQGRLRLRVHRRDHLRLRGRPARGRLLPLRLGQQGWLCIAAAGLLFNRFPLGFGLLSSFFFRLLFIIETEKRLEEKERC